MYAPMRRKDRQLEKSEALKILYGAQYGVLSMVQPSSLPYGVPLSFIVIDESIYFHSAKTGQKADCLRHQPRASFCAVDGVQAVFDKNFTTYYESAIVFGSVHLLDDEDDMLEKNEALSQLCRKYLPQHMDKADAYIADSYDQTAVYRLTIEHITGKAKRPDAMRPAAE